MTKEEFLKWAIAKKYSGLGRLESNYLDVQLILLRRTGEISEAEYQKFFQAQPETPKHDLRTGSANP